MQPPKVAQKSLQFNFIEENLGDILVKDYYGPPMAFVL
jgi:hypothetical protein